MYEGRKTVSGEAHVWIVRKIETNPNQAKSSWMKFNTIQKFELGVPWPNPNLYSNPNPKSSRDKH